MDRCNELCTKEMTGQCTLCEALAERDRFIRLWMKGGLEDLLIEGDKIATRWTCCGTHHGVFIGMAPTGKRVTFTGMTLYRMAQGKIVEQWTVEDGVSLYQQLGLLRS